MKRLVPILLLGAMSAGTVLSGERGKYAGPLSMDPAPVSADKSVKYDYDIVYVRAPRTLAPARRAPAVWLATSIPGRLAAGSFGRGFVMPRLLAGAAVLVALAVYQGRACLGQVSKAVLLLGAGVLGLAAVSAWLLGPRPGDGINPENYGRIREGMTRAEVEAILGTPEGDYGTGKVLLIDDGTSGTIHVPHLWLTEDFGIQVEFDQDQRVTWKRSGPVLRTPATWRDRLRCLLPW